MADLHTYTASDSDRIRRFVVEDAEAIAGPGRQRFSGADDARGHPIAEALFAVPGVQEVIIEGNAVLVLRRPDASWDDLGDRVGYALSTALASPRGHAATGPALDDDAIFELTARIFARDINPAVAQHGGKVELIDVQDGTVIVRMLGGCQGCGMANVTLRQGIEASLRKAIPGLQGLADITDHASGRNPYFK